MVASVAHAGGAVGGGRHPPGAVEIPGDRLPDPGQREAFHTAVPSVRDVYILSSDRDAARLAKLIFPAAPPPPAAEVPALGIENAQPGVAEVGNPEAPLLVDCRVARLFQISEDGRACGRLVGDDRRRL